MKNRPLVESSWVGGLTALCIGLIFAIGVADFVFVYLDLFPSRILGRSFNVALEESVGTWFSSALALWVALTAAAVFWHSRRHDVGILSLGWALIALIFLFISIDDTAKIHERLGTAMRVKYEQTTDTELDTWFPSWGWQLFVAPIYAAMGVYMLWFLNRVLPSREKKYVVLGFTLLGLAVCLDFIEGQFARGIEEDVDRHLQQLTEELLEMLGTTVFLYVFLRVLSTRVEVSVTDRWSTERPSDQTHNR